MRQQGNHGKNGDDVPQNQTKDKKQPSKGEWFNPANVVAFILFLLSGPVSYVANSPKVLYLGAVALSVMAFYGAHTIVVRIENQKTAQPATPEPQSPFRVKARTALIVSPALAHSPFMVRYTSIYGKTISPVAAFIFFQIINLQEVASTIEEYSISVGSTEHGPWLPSLILPMATRSVFFINNAIPSESHPARNLSLEKGAYMFGSEPIAANLKTAAKFEPQPKLEIEIRRTIWPRQTVTGWLAFALTKTGMPIGGFINVTMRDTSGIVSSSVCEFPNKRSSNPENESETAIVEGGGNTVDLSRDRLHLYDEPFSN